MCAVRAAEARAPLRRGRRQAGEGGGSWAAGGAIGPTAAEGGAGRSRAAAGDVGGELSRDGGGRAGSGSGDLGAPAKGCLCFVLLARRLPSGSWDPQTPGTTPPPRARPGCASSQPPPPVPRSNRILPDPSRSPAASDAAQPDVGAARASPRPETRAAGGPPRFARSAYLTQSGWRALLRRAGPGGGSPGFPGAGEACRLGLCERP